MPKLVFLGTGAAIPAKDDVRHEIATWLSDGKSCNVLVDCGEGTKYNLLRAGLSRRVHYIFLTHDHYDHIMGLTGLLATLSLTNITPLPIAIYGPRPALERAEILAGLVRSHPGATLNLDMDFRSLEDGGQVELGPAQVAAFATAHREKESLGYIFIQGGTRPHKIVFSGDTCYLPHFVEVACKATWLVVNANYAENETVCPSQHGHMSVMQAAELAHAANAERLFLQHLSPRYAKRHNDVLSAARRVFPETYLAEDLQEVS